MAKKAKKKTKKEEKKTPKKKVKGVLDENRVIYWIGQGAQPSATVSNIMKRSGINFRLHLMKMGKSEDEIATELENWRTEQENRINSADSSNQPVIDIIPDEPAADVIESDDAVEAESASESDVPVEENSEESIKTEMSSSE